MIKTWALKIFNDNIKFMLQDLVINVSFIYTQMAMYKKLRFCWLIQSHLALVALLYAVPLFTYYSTCGQMADNGLPFANRIQWTELQHYCVCGSGNRNLGNYEIFGWKYFLYMIVSCRIQIDRNDEFNSINMEWEFRECIELERAVWKVIADCAYSANIHLSVVRFLGNFKADGIISRAHHLNMNSRTRTGIDDSAAASAPTADSHRMRCGSVSVFRVMKKNGKIENNQTILQRNIEDDLQTMADGEFKTPTYIIHIMTR